jgi:hypothetical protein
LALGDVGQDARVSAAPPPPEEAASQGAMERIVLSGLPFGIARQRAIEAFERMYVSKVLAAHGGNVAHAAAASGIARRQLQRVKARLKP